MSNLSAVEKHLLGEIGLRLNRSGFNNKRIGQSFRRATSFGWESIHVAFVRHPPADFDVIVNFGIRIDAVQDVILGDDPLLTVSDRKNSATVGCELGNLTGQGQRRWTVSSEEDIPSVAAQIVGECEVSIFPIFEKYASPAAIYADLTQDEMTAELLAPFPASRAKIIEALSTIVRK